MSSETLPFGLNVRRAAAFWGSLAHFQLSPITLAPQSYSYSTRARTRFSDDSQREPVISRLAVRRSLFTAHRLPARSSPRTPASTWRGGRIRCRMLDA